MPSVAGHFRQLQSPSRKVLFLHVAFHLCIHYSLVAGQTNHEGQSLAPTKKQPPQRSGWQGALDLNAPLYVPDGPALTNS